LWFTENTVDNKRIYCLNSIIFLDHPVHVALKNLYLSEMYFSAMTFIESNHVRPLTRKN